MSREPVQHRDLGFLTRAATNDDTAMDVESKLGQSLDDLIKSQKKPKKKQVAAKVSCGNSSLI